MTAVIVEAPAKINLGLEILGKRDDGFHEIRSILAMTTLRDTLTFTLAKDGHGVQFVGTRETIDPNDNLVVKAIGAFNEAAGTAIVPQVRVDKRIPAAAGLGGASSDAAAALLAMQSISGGTLPVAALQDLAASIGSDVPFFLGSPVALVRGRGTEMSPLPDLRGHLLIVMPDIAIERKTARLYGALQPEDFSTGRTVEDIAEAIRNRDNLPSEFPNAFDRAFRVLDPRMDALIANMTSAGVGAGFLSGAGPARVLLFDTAKERDATAVALRPWIDATDRLYSCEFAAGGR
jgi:4-diphosphocytidyl-2-C-methyl-D-erythritol kinase